MKFGKRLKQQIQQSLPDWRHQYLSYKKLKKLIKLISEEEFIYLLTHEIHKFNAFFIDQEEDFIIRHKDLSQRTEKLIERWSEPSQVKEIAKIRKDIVNFHGEMILLINYSNINYTGLAKILKKYDKQTGGVLRLPFIEKVIEQPFFMTDLISKLVKECETTIDLVFPPPSQSNGIILLFQPQRKSVAIAGEEGIFNNTIAALSTMQEIRSGSSTYSHFSLPPLNLPDFEAIQSLQVLLPIQIP